MNNQLTLTLVCLLFSSCTIARAGTFTDQATNLHFPDAIGEWHKTRVTQFPEKHLGVEIDYQGRGGAIASFYVYSGGASKISTGAENGMVKGEFAVAQREQVASMQSRFGNVSKILESNPDVTHQGKRATMLATAYKFTSKRDWLSWILLTGYRNRFLKLYYTHPFGNPKTDIPRGQQELRDLVLGFLNRNHDNTDAFWMSSHQ